MAETRVVVEREFSGSFQHGYMRLNTEQSACISRAKSFTEKYKV